MKGIGLETDRFRSPKCDGFANLNRLLPANECDAATIGAPDDFPNINVDLRSLLQLGKVFQRKRLAMKLDRKPDAQGRDDNQ